MPGPAITFPSPPVNYTDVLASAPSRLLGDDPPEGKRVLEAGIDWGQARYAGGVVAIDVGQARTVNPVSRISALWVDNVKCNTDVQFIFIDTGHVLTVPGKSAGLYPVNAQGTGFIVFANTPLASDVTRFAVYNYMPPPVAVAETNFVSTSQATLAAIAAGTTPIIPAGQSGVVTGINLQVAQANGGAAVGAYTFTFQDGSATPIVLAKAVYTQNAGAFRDFAEVLNLAQNLRFNNGVNMVITLAGTAFTSGIVQTNVFSR